MPKLPGTILPTRETLDNATKYHANRSHKAAKIGEKLLSHCRKAIVGGETRYYESDTKYAVVSLRSLSVL